MTRRPIRPFVLARAAVFALAAIQLGACAGVNAEVISVGGRPAAAPAALGLAPSIGPNEDALAVISADQEAVKLAQMYAEPPASTGAVIQDQQVYGEPAESPDAAYPENVYGPAPVPQAEYVDPGDPMEPLNRGAFAINDALDTVILEPLASTYRVIVPAPVRTSVRSFLANLGSPVTFANDVLQGELSRAEVTLARFMFNSTLGVGGLIDFAAENGLNGHREDFDQTMAVYGVPSGPYIVVPVLGPATPRHIIGRVVDSAFHPLTWILAPVPIEYSLAERAAEGVVAREEVLDSLNETRANSVDYYRAIQSFYRQNRSNEITNGQVPVDASGNEVDPYAGIDVDF